MSNRKIKIAFVGATSQISMGLIESFAQFENYELYLYARSMAKLDLFISSIKTKCNITTDDFEKFDTREYNLIINCIGVVNFKKQEVISGEIFFLTEQFDNMILQYMLRYPDTQYVNFSSGAVYGSEFSDGADKNTGSLIYVNRISDMDFYRIAKINSEAKHRSMKDLKIIDLRVFAYFSKYISMSTGLFITEVINSVLEHKTFITNSSNMVRDYIGPDDLFLLVKCCLTNPNNNTAFDVYSKGSVTKFEVLDYFEKKYGFKYEIQEDFFISTTTGYKSNYYSKNRSANQIGYEPQYSSLDVIIKGSEQIMKIKKAEVKNNG